MIVLIDNYDSFSYNLYQLIGKYDADIHVYRNDKITVDELDALQPEAIILSPGRANRQMQASVRKSSRSCIQNIRFLGYVWGIRQSVKPLAHQLLMRNK